MDRRTRNLFVLVLVVVIAATGGAAILLGGNGVVSPRASASAPPSLAPRPPRSWVDGVIVHVESQGLDKVQAISIRTDEGGTIRFMIGVLENAAEFPPGHLGEHQATGQAVRVWYVTEGDVRVAVRIDDAP